MTGKEINKLKTFCIIGDPIHHSLSPSMQNAAFSFLKLSYSYIAFKVKEDELADSIESMRKIGIAGFNVTIPHKVNVIKYLDKITPESKLAGAVNTVLNENDLLLGYNTDIYGFIHPLERAIKKFSGLNILLLGAGGASRAALVGLSGKESINNVWIFNRNQERLRNILQLGNDLGLPCSGFDLNDIANLNKFSLKSDLIINSTSMGLKNEICPIESSSINKECVIFDMVYKPIYTDLLSKAKEREARIIFGYEMLLYQGVKAFEIFTKHAAPIDVMKKALVGIFGEPS